MFICLEGAHAAGKTTQCLLLKEKIEKEKGKKPEELYQIENNERDKLPQAVLLFSILENKSF